MNGAVHGALLTCRGGFDNRKAPLLCATELGGAEGAEPVWTSAGMPYRTKPGDRPAIGPSASLQTLPLPPTDRAASFDRSVCCSARSCFRQSRRTWKETLQFNGRA